MDHEMGLPYQLVFSVQIFHVAQYRTTGYFKIPIVHFPSFECNS